MSKTHRLLINHRLDLYNAAGVALIDPKLRKKANDAKAKFFGLLEYDAAHVTLKELVTLRKYRQTGRITHIKIPTAMTLKIGTKTIDVPGGQQVEREVIERVDGPLEPFDPSVSWDYAKRGYSDSQWRPNCTSITQIALPTSLEVPGHFRNGELQFNEKEKGPGFDVAATVAFISPKTFSALEAWFIAAKAADTAERELRRVVRTVIASATTIEDVIAVYPPAAAQMDELFPEIPRSHALVCLNDDDRALLCANLKARKVEGAGGAACCAVAA